MMKILVTGSTGLVGKAIYYYVKEQNTYKKYSWYFVSSKDADLCSIEQTRELIDKYRPTHVIHLAAYVGGLYRNQNEPAKFWNKNTQMNFNIMQACYECDSVTKFLSCLSTCIFPDKIDQYPIDEPMLHNGPPHDSNYSYAMSKRMIDIQGRIYNKSALKEKRNILYTTVSPCNIYGKYDNFSIDDGHVIPALIHKFVISKGEVRIRGSGEAMRQFVFSKDLAKIICWAIVEYDEQETLIVSPDPEESEVSINHVINLLKKVSKKECEIIHDMTFTEGQKKKTVSNLKLRSFLPEFEFTPLNEGLRQTYDWLKKNYENSTIVRL